MKVYWEPSLLEIPMGLGRSTLSHVLSQCLELHCPALSVGNLQQSNNFSLHKWLLSDA